MAGLPVRTRARQLARRAVNRAGYDVVRDPFPRRLRRLLAAAGIDAVLDVGANQGQYAAGLRIARFDGRLVSCEPLGDVHAALARRAAGDPDWTPVRTAVGAEVGTVTLHRSANTHSSSVLDMLPAHLAAAPDSGYVATEEVPLTTVDTLLDRYGLAPARTLLKIDVQGYEAAVLDGAAGALPDLAGVQVELSLVPLYAGQPLMPETMARLTGAGLALCAIEPGFTDPETGRMLQCDGVFLRDRA
jgi:FkbM family methyltransferase